jgi:mono/diheme cytochrome c family protein
MRFAKPRLFVLPPFLLLAAAAATACSSDDAPDEPTGPTYWQDVQPILHTSCTTCHTAGGIGPFALDHPQMASSMAGLIAKETTERTMPPWPPGGDTPKLLHDRSLPQAQIDLIAAWAAAGAPLGDASKPAPQIEPEVIDIGATELQFDVGTSYVPDTSLDDDYRCFLADLGSPSTRMATGFKVTPGNRAIVHHVIVGLVAGADRSALEALDAQTPDRAGWPCVGGLIPDGVSATQVGSLGSWVPGVSAVAFPRGTGELIPAGSLAVIQMHYNLLGGSDPDRTKVDVALAPPEANATLIRLGGLGLVKRNLQIAADQAAAVHTQSATVAQWRTARGGQPFPAGKGYVLAVGGHMHMIGKRILLTRSNTSGTTTLLDIPSWSFHWQGQYQFATPIEVANTDTLTIRCEHDNSNQNRLAHGLPASMPVTWGEGSLDEMCLGSVQVVDRLP